MGVWRSLDDIDSDLGPRVVTVGNFDGVHRGHQHVLQQAGKVADEAGQLPVVAITFDPHPMRILLPERAPHPLTTMARRVELLHEAGADHVLILPFDREMASWSPEEFIQRVLVDAVNASAVVVGENFRFGAKAAGNTQILARLGEQHGFTVHALELTGAEHPWSSSSIRQCLAEGNVVAAGEALGRPHDLTGVVVEGEHRGRELGFPTANVPAGDTMAVPADGVYAGRLRILPADGEPGEWQPGAISVGSNPTFDGTGRVVETYVLDRDDLELYGVTVQVSFSQRIRGQLRFESVKELVDRMCIDVAEAQALLARNHSADR